MVCCERFAQCLKYESITTMGPEDTQTYWFRGKPDFEGDGWDDE